MTGLLPRGLTNRVAALLGAVPVVILEGPRASGKTAIGSILGDQGRIQSTVDLSDPTVLSAAQGSPTILVDNLDLPAFVDEAQLAPELVLAVKRRVDREHQNGAFVLTGSSRLGRSQLGGADPLAGRSARLRLWPMTQGELVGHPVNAVADLLSGEIPHGTHAALTKQQLIERVRRGGLPGLAGLRGALDVATRSQLVAEYVEGVAHHEDGKRHDRAELLRTFRYLAATTSRILNVSNAASDLVARRETLNGRIATLESIFLIHLLPAHRSSEHRTLTAHPKVHVVDTALAAWAARADDDVPAELYGGLVETFVVNELVAQASWCSEPPAVRHWRDTTRKLEVDAVLVREDGRSIAIEVKASADVRPDDLRGLHAYLASDSAALFGIVYYSGGLVLPLGERIWALPISSLWQH